MPKVVIVGAGFGGLAAAKRLAGKPVDVTLVDRRNHHLFQPLLYQVATAALSPADIAAPIRSIFADAPNVRVLLDEVTGIAPSATARLARSQRLARLRLADPRHRRAPQLFRPRRLGAARAGPQEHRGCDSPSAGACCSRWSMPKPKPIARRRSELLTFVVIGGGPTGVEMAGAIAELARRTVSRDFRSITPRCSRVVLVEAGPRILPSFPP